MIFSTIDIGTNTILMVTLGVRRDGTIEVLGDEHEIARLGKGVDAERRIMPDAFDRVAGYLLGYKAIAERLGSERIVAFGTSALRDAANREEFIAAMRERTGIAIEVLSGAQEAEYTYRGALFGIDASDAVYGVLDIGGGSTEIACGHGGSVEQATSIDIGAVRITERFLDSLPPTPERIAEARAHAAAMLGTGFALPSGVIMVGVAGTVTTLGAIAMGMEHFDAAALNGIRLSREDIERITSNLCSMQLQQIAAMPQVHPARADILPGGALILNEFMRHHNLPEIIVSTRGVRYGAAMESMKDEVWK